MASWKFRVEHTGGFSEHHVVDRGKLLESLGTMAFAAETRNYDDTDPDDARCIKNLDIHKTWDEATNTFVKTFTKLSA